MNELPVPRSLCFLYICKDVWDRQGANKLVDSARNVIRTSLKKVMGMQCMDAIITVDIQSDRAN